MLLEVSVINLKTINYKVQSIDAASKILKQSDFLNDISIGTENWKYCTSIYCIRLFLINLTADHKVFHLFYLWYMKTMNISQIVKYKSRTLQRIRRYVNIVKANLLAYAFIKSQFCYASTIWIFTEKTLVN